MEENESGAWYVMTTLVITYFLFRITHIFVIVTTERCISHQVFWFSKDSFGLSVFTLFIAVFVMIGCWAVSETVRAFILHYQDRFLCLSITALVLVALASVLAISRAQYEAYEIIYGSRSYDDYNFKLDKSVRPIPNIKGVYIDGKHSWAQCQKANK